MDVIVLDYSNGSVNKIHNIPDDLSSSKIEDILHKQFHLSNCSWMFTDDCNIYHYRYNNSDLIYEGY